jgi:imidazolonepropionase-like amidohydrolase
MARTLFTGGHVYDGTGAAPGRADVVVEDGRIVAVGIGLDGDEQVDAAGMTLLPGFFDCHVHVVLSHIDMLRLINTPLTYRFFEAARNLRTLLDAGITTVRDAAGADLGVKRAVADGLIEGPRMQISVGMICQTGGHNDGWMLSGTRAQALFPVYPGVPETVADGPDEVRRAVRLMLRSGADVIKIATSGGIMSPRDSPHHAHFRDDEIEIAVREAAAAGAWVMSHAQACAGVKSAVRAGVRSIEHGIALDDEAIQLMLDAGTFLVPTLVAPLAVIEAAEAGLDIDPDMVSTARSVTEQHRDSVRRAAAAGVRIAMGTDSGISPHGRNLRELEILAELGLSPSEALRTCTSTAAELLGFQDQLGTIEAGKRADLVLVDGDPLDLATLANRIRAVFRDGRQVAGDPLLAQPHEATLAV